MRQLTILALMTAALTPGCFLLRLAKSGNQELPPSAYQKEVVGAQDVIVFVHGLWGGRDGTWINDETGADFRILVANDSTPFDLRGAAMRLKDFSIFSVSYYSPKLGEALGPPDLAVRIEDQLKRKGIFDYSRVHFITHSMGGIAVKEMLLNMQTAKSPYLSHVRTVMLIASPARGSNLAEYASKILGLTKSQVNALTPIVNNTFLQSQDIRWETFIRDGREAGLPRVFCAFEGQMTSGFYVVTREQAVTACDDRLYGMDSKTHSGTVKPASRTDDPYEWVVGNIRDALRFSSGSLSVSIPPNQTLLSAIRFVVNQDGAVVEFDSSCGAEQMKRHVRARNLRGIPADLIRALATDMEDGGSLKLTVSASRGVYEVACER